MKMGLRIAQRNLDGAISPSRPGFETQSVHTVDELERSDVLSYLGKISVGDVQAHVRHEGANHEYTWLFIRIPNPPSYAIILPPSPK